MMQYTIDDELFLRELEEGKNVFDEWVRKKSENLEKIKLGPLVEIQNNSIEIKKMKEEENNLSDRKIKLSQEIDSHNEELNRIINEINTLTFQSNSLTPEIKFTIENIEKENIEIQEKRNGNKYF